MYIRAGSQVGNNIRAGRQVGNNIRVGRQVGIISELVGR